MDKNNGKAAQERTAERKAAGRRAAESKAAGRTAEESKASEKRVGGETAGRTTRRTAGGRTAARRAAADRTARGAADAGTAYERSRMSMQRRHDELVRRTVVFGIGIFIVVLAVIGYVLIFHDSTPANVIGTDQTGPDAALAGEDNTVPQPDIDVQLLTVNEYSRPGIPTDKITGIVVHYLANPMTTAQENRDYFESLKDLQNDYLSSNFIIGLDGEIVQCVPTSEMAYASNSRNQDTVSIECCHPDETGQYNQATYDSLVRLTAYLCGKFGLEKDQIIRHFDVTGKLCPKYFVDHEDKWEEFKQEVADYMEECGKK